MKSHPNDLRWRIVEAYQSGESTQKESPSCLASPFESQKYRSGCDD